MPEIPAMTGAELQATKEFLGLTTGWLAHRLVIDDRRIRRMEASRENIPTVIIGFLDDLYEDTKNQVDVWSSEYRRKVKAAEGTVTLKTYRTDETYKAAGGQYPAKWHRMCAARVAAAVPGLILTHEE